MREEQEIMNYDDAEEMPPAEEPMPQRALVRREDNAMDVRGGRREDASLSRHATPPERRPGPSMSSNVDDFFEALISAKLEFPPIVKNRVARVQKGQSVYTYRYSNLADVMDQIDPIMRKHKLAHVTMPMGNRVYVRVVHQPSKQWIEGVLPLALPDHGSDVQRMGSSLTYTERYLLCRLLGIVAADDEDDDGAAAHAAAGARR